MSKSEKLKKRHHIQSEFYLRRFAVPAARAADPDRFWVYRRGQATPLFLPPESTAIRSHFYSYRDESGQRNDEIEHLLADVEGVAAPVLTKLTSVGFPLTALEQGRLTFFFALAATRTPNMRARGAEVVEADHVADIVRRTTVQAEREVYAAARAWPWPSTHAGRSRPGAISRAIICRHRCSGQVGGLSRR